MLCIDLLNVSMKISQLHRTLFFTDIVNLTDESHAQVTRSALLKNILQ